MFDVAEPTLRGGVPTQLRRCQCSLYFCLVMLAPSVAVAAEMSRPAAAENGPTQIRLRIGVVDVDEINSANQSFTANVYLEARWRDPRLVHESEAGQVYPLENVWHPRLQIINQQRVIRTFPEVVEVLPSGEVVYRQRIWGSFSQRLDVHDFPFDRQVFRVLVAAAAFSPSQVRFVKDADGQPKVVAELSVADWRIADWKQRPNTFTAIGSSDLVPAYELSFQAQRYTGYYLVKVIFPLVLIVAMSWTVFWINPEQSGTQIGISTTSMLTLIAYRFMVGGSLPPVSYLTRMDYFMFGSMILVFITLVEAVMTAVLADAGRTKLAQRIDWWCRVAFPVMFLVVCGLAFVS